MKLTLVILSIKNIIKNKRITLLNILGLSIGIGFFLLIMNYIISEISYDKNITNYSKIYRLISKAGGKNELSSGCAAPFASTLKKDFPEVIDALRISKYRKFFIKKDFNSFYQKKVLYADANFFTFFNNKAIDGTLNNCLSEPNTTVLTKSVALKLFGSKSAINQSILVDSQTYKVTAVVDDNFNSNHLKYDLLLSMSSDKSSNNESKYLSFLFKSTMGPK